MILLNTEVEGIRALPCLIFVMHPNSSPFLIAWCLAELLRIPKEAQLRNVIPLYEEKGKQALFN
jgi:hypothetical protein